MPTYSEKPLLTRLQWVLLFVVIPLWIIQVRYVIASIQTPGGFPFWTNHDFSHYYVTAERVLTGASDVYCAAFTAEETTRRGLQTGGVEQPTNPPLLTLALSPIAYVPILESWILYTAIGLSFMSLTLWLAMRRCDGLASATTRSRLLLIIVMSAPILSLLQYSQVQGWILALVLSAWLLTPKHRIIAGMLLGSTVALKVYTAPLLVFVLAIRDYKMFLAAVGTAVVGIFLPQMVDPRLNIFHFISCGATHVSTWALECTANQAVSGLLRTMAYLSLVPLGLAGIEPIKISNHYAGIVLWMASGLLVGLAFRGRREPHQGFLAAVALSIVCAPVAWPHYFLMTWPYLVQRWSGLSLGTQLIFWFSFPLYPCYMVEGENPDWLATITNLGSSALVWIPGTIFTIQLIAIFYKDLTSRSR